MGFKRTNWFSPLVLAALVIVGATLGFRALESYLYQLHLKSVAAQTQALPSFGIAAGSSLTAMSSSQVDDYFVHLQNLGAGWVRLDFDWSQIQPDGSTTYKWSTYDNIVRLAGQHQLRVIGIIDFAPDWARAGDCRQSKQCRPANPAEYARFAGAVSARYEPAGLHYWEIWNEPNTSAFFKPAANIKSYADLLVAASKSIHQRDRAAIVISGSTAPAATAGGNISPSDFLSGLYVDGAGTAFDAVGAHPYTFPVPPNYKSQHAWANLSQGQASIRAIMIQNRDASKKVWITEFGAPTDGPGPAADAANLHLSQHPWHVTEALQAASLQQAFDLYRTYDWVGPMLVYSYQDAGTDTANSENFFGLVRADGSEKPAYDVVKQAFAKP